MPPAVAVVLAVGAFFALVVFGLGMTSLAVDESVIATPGLGQVPGILGVAVAAMGFAGSLWGSVRRGRPAYRQAVWPAVAAYLGYLVGVGAGAVFTGTDLAVAAAVVGRLALGWFGPVVAAAAAVSALTAIGLVRGRGDRPQWPWERAAPR